MSRKKIFTQNQIRSAIEKLAQTILKKTLEPKKDWIFVGIQRRGVPLAERLSEKLNQLGEIKTPVGTLDITFYRDDMGADNLDPVVQDTNVPFDINGKIIFLVDDVLFTGRTIRCALDELMDFGRPQKVYLVALVDRGHRELPIHADFIGDIIKTDSDQVVEVHLEEVDGEDAVWLLPLPVKSRTS